MLTNPRYIGFGLIGLGFCFGAGVTAWHAWHRSDFELITLGFGLVGVGLIVMQGGALMKWDKHIATIDNVEGGDPPTLYMTYSVNDVDYPAKVSVTSFKQVGDNYTVLVNPDNPADNVPHSWVGLLLGGIFALTGLVGLINFFAA